jgi:hypothetical protein
MVLKNRLFKEDNKKDIFIIIFFLYYWICANVLVFDEATPTTLLVFIQLPIIIYVLVQVRYFELEYKNSVNGYFLLFLVAVLAVNIVRRDFRLILSTGVDVLPTYIILTNRRIFISTRFINYLFFIQVSIAVISYYLGLNQYGFFPGQSTLNEYSWKVSLFSFITPPYTSIFCFFVLLANAESHLKLKWINVMAMVLSAYFIIFSGSRTVFLICLFYILFRFFLRFMKLNLWPKFYTLFPFLVIGLALLIGQGIKTLNNSLLNAIFIRNVERTSYYNVAEDLDRYVLWREYLQVFWKHWFIGSGTFDVNTFSPDNVGTTETLLPLQLAFHGIVYFLFLIGMFNILRLAIKFQLTLSYIAVVTFLVVSSFYGSYLRGYSLIWIFLFALIANDFNTYRVIQKRVLQLTGA